MANALSNPYEIEVGGMKIKCSPYSNGSFISDNDVSDNIVSVFADALGKTYDFEYNEKMGGFIIKGVKNDKEASESECEQGREVASIEGRGTDGKGSGEVQQGDGIKPESSSSTSKNKK